MSALKAADVRRRLKDVASLPPLILVFGPDRGLVTETSGAIEALFAGSGDPFAVVKLDAATVAGETGRLADEARTVSLFGERRLVMVRDGGSRNLAPALAPLMDEPPQDAVVLVEAGDIKRGTGLRKEFEAAQDALAIFCPADGERDLARMVDEVAAEVGVAVEAEARAELVARLGADRAGSRSEALKACLHALDGGMLRVEDVDAVVGDVSVSAVSEAIDAAFLGKAARLDELLTKLLAQDSAAAQLLVLAQRHVHSLELCAAAVAEGMSPHRASEEARPPFYGPRKEAAARTLERWTPRKLRRASMAIAEATFATRLRPALAGAIARDAMLRIAAQTPAVPQRGLRR